MEYYCDLALLQLPIPDTIYIHNSWISMNNSSSVVGALVSNQSYVRRNVDLCPEIRLSNYSTVILISLCIGVFGLLLKLQHQRRVLGLPFPPGPWALPLIGNINHGHARFFLFLSSLRKFGPVASFRLGWMNFVVLNNVATIREAYSKEVFTGRPRCVLSDSMSHNSGILFQDGESWRLHRKLTMRILKRLGLGRHTVEVVVQQEAQRICDHLRGLLTAPVSTNDIFCASTAKVISGITFGAEMKPSDSAAILEKLRLTSRNVSLPELLPFFCLPLAQATVEAWTRRSPHMRNIFENLNALNTLIIENIKSRRDLLTSSKSASKANNVLSAYLFAQKEAQKAGREDFDDWKILRVVLELFLAGSDTTSAALCWAVLALSLHKDVQERATREVHHVLGPQRMVAMTDRRNLPYITALVDECLRYGCVTPFGGIVHKALEDADLCGFGIPKNTFLVSNMFSIFRDPKLWKHPNTFNPRNFLDEDGNYTPSEYFIAFQVGKRSCLGESLARMELFIFITSLVQHFRMEWTPLPQQENDSNQAGILEEILLGTEGSIRCPGPHRIRFYSLSSR